MSDLQLVEVPLFQLSIKINNLGQLYADTEVVNEEELKKRLEKWDPEYQNTPKILKMIRLAKELSAELVETIQREVQAL